MLMVTPPPSLGVSESQQLPDLTSRAPLGAPEAQATAIAATHLARTVTTVTSGHSQQKVSELLTAQLAQQTGKILEQYLNRWGQVQVNLGVNPRRFSLDTSQITALFPLWRQQTLPEQRLLFTQFGLHHQRHHKTTVNFGIGQRHLFSEGWLLGYNLFYDLLLPHHHQRLGLGLEARRDYLSLGVNGYYPISQWKSEKESDHSVARPARGVDMIVDAYLPQHPQLGVKVHAERYFDDRVGTFMPHTKQCVASVSLGLHYTPVPLFKLSYDYTFGQRAANRCRQQVALTVDYQLGVPFAQQLESTQVAQQRSLMGSLLAPVQRNNQILLAYKEKIAVQLQLPNEEELGNIGTMLTIPLTIQGDLSSYTLTFAGSLATAAQANANNRSLTVKLPHAVGRHTLQVIATNQQGKQSPSNELTIQVVNVPENVLRAARYIRRLGSWNNYAGDLAAPLVVQTAIWPRDRILRIDDEATNPRYNYRGRHQLPLTIRFRKAHYQFMKNGNWSDAPAYSGGGNCFYDAILALLEENGTPANVTVSELRKMVAQVLLDNPDTHPFAAGY
jgi:adhesin/invasin